LEKSLYIQAQIDPGGLSLYQFFCPGDINNIYPIMKKLMTLILAVVPFGMTAQEAQKIYDVSNDVFSQAYADASENAPVVKAFDKEARDDEMYEVSDMLLADPDFEVQEDMISYTKDQKTVFFSANKKLKIKKNNQADTRIKNSVQLQLFKADVKANGEWVNLEMLPFNSTKHSTGHPALNGDDTKLYFVSDGLGSTGKTDIFVVDLLEDGTYGSPENMGPMINTMEREVYPFIDDQSVLYFASDIETEGAELDVFASKVIDDEPMAPVKLDVEANGSKDDYIKAYSAVDAEALRLAEEAANLRDLEILLEAETLAEIENLKKTYVGSMSGKAYNFDSEKIIYTVQVGAFLQNVRGSSFKSSSGLYNYQYKDGYNRFYSGVFQSEEEALVHLKKMQGDGYEDAFVLGLKGKSRFLP
jgi:hypothetical protein